MKLFYIAPLTLFLHVVVLFSAFAAYFILPIRAANFLEIGNQKIKNRFSVFVSIYLFLFIFLLVQINHRILHRFMNSADEFSCFFLAKCFLSGRAWAEIPPLKEFFETTHLGMLAGKWFSVYPPGWPLFWAIGMRFSLQDAMNPILLGGALALLVWPMQKIYGKAAVAFGFFFLLLSPYFILTGAAYYSHNACLFFLALFIFLLFRFKEKGETLAAAGAGLALGMAFAVRYLTSLAIAAPFLIAFCCDFLKGEKKLVKGLAALALCAFALVAFQAVYNFLITGNFFNPPNHFLHAHERLGFIAGYSPRVAVEYLWKRILYLMDWTPPGILILFFAALLTRINDRWDLLCRLAILFLVGAYFFYYSWGGNQFGPRYYFEAYPFVCFLAGKMFCEICHNPDLRWKSMAMGLLLSMIVTSVPMLKRHLSFTEKMTLERKSVYSKSEEVVRKPALVFLRGFLGDALVLSLEDAIRNDPFLKNEILYAKDLNEKNPNLCHNFPERYSYRAYYDRKQHLPVIEPYACR